MYVNQLEESKQAEILVKVKTFLENEGLEESEITEALENALNSKMHDLNEILTLKEINHYKKGVDTSC